MRNLKFEESEFYHIFNRGVDKRIIFASVRDLDRFMKGISEFNTSERIGNIDRNHSESESKKLVEFVAYCLNPNHYHFILRPICDKGIERFMHKIGMGYAKYFNIRNRRSGSLFQGKFKAVHIETNEQLLHTSVYVNLNNRVHRYPSNTFFKSSWNEYFDKTNQEKICAKNIVLEQFKNEVEYKRFAEESLRDIIKKKDLVKELEGESVLTPSVNRKKRLKR